MLDAVLEKSVRIFVKLPVKIPSFIVSIYPLVWWRWLRISVCTTNLERPTLWKTFPRTNAYDAVVSTGVFTAGHVKKEAIEELSRVTRPGGFLIIGCQELVFESEGYVAYLETLKEEGVVQLYDILRSFTMKKAGIEINIVVIGAL